MSGGADLTAGDFFDGARGALYGVLHPPSLATPSTGLGVVTVAPFMEERQDTHELYRSLALGLSARGATVLRFDLYGTGDSAGRWEDASIEGWLGDIAAAVVRLRQEPGVRDIALVGMRFGALLAATAVARRVEASKVVLVQPVLKGAGYVMDVLRAHLAAEMVLHKRAGVTRESLVESLRSGESVNLFGYRFTPAQHDAMVGLDAGTSLARFQGKSLLVDVARTEAARANKELDALKTQLDDKATLVRAVEAQTLYVEGKQRVVRAEGVEGVVVPWLMEG